MSHIESRPSRSDSGYDFYIEFICRKEELLNQLTAKLEEIASSISLMTEGGRGNKGNCNSHSVYSCHICRECYLDVL